MGKTVRANQWLTAAIVLLIIFAHALSLRIAYSYWMTHVMVNPILSMSSSKLLEWDSICGHIILLQGLSSAVINFFSSFIINIYYQIKKQICNYNIIIITIFTVYVFITCKSCLFCLIINNCINIPFYSTLTYYMHIWISM